MEAGRKLLKEGKRDVIDLGTKVGAQGKKAKTGRIHALRVTSLSSLNIQNLMFDIQTKVHNVVCR